MAATLAVAGCSHSQPSATSLTRLTVDVTLLSGTDPASNRMAQAADPAVGFPVMAKDSHGHVISAKTDGTGQAVFHLAPGHFALSSPDCHADAVPVTVTGTASTVALRCSTAASG